MKENDKWFVRAILPFGGVESWSESTISLVLGWGWLVLIVVLLWVIWRVYMTIKMIDYVSAIRWTFLQIKVPEEAEQTPKAIESAFDIWDGIHKGADLVERYFDGYIEAWYSCEIRCIKDKAQYIMVVPTAHRSFFEGVIYGQYPQAEITEVEDYTLRYSWKDIDKEFDLYGTELDLVDDDYLPIKTYREYEDIFAEEEKYVDPHQALIEAYTNIPENQEFWVQILVRPIDPVDIAKWEKKGEAEIDKLAGKEPKNEMGLMGQIAHGLLAWPVEILKAFIEGPIEAGKSTSGALDFPRVSAADSAKMDGILRKISQGGYKVKIRLLHLAPIGQLHKPNISRAIGAFKQFNTFNMNAFMPGPDTKTNGPNYIMKQWRRYMRKRRVFLNYQWRDLGKYEDGYMLSAEELATLYHFPVKYVKAPAVERSKAGVGAAPDNLPYPT